MLKIVFAIAAFVTVAGATPLCAYDYNASDFAAEVVSYTPGGDIKFDVISFQLFNDPCTALGRPSQVTTVHSGLAGEANDAPVNPVHPPWRAYQVVTVGTGGQLTLKFDHPVANDARNPYGADFLIFGNARIHILGGTSWSSTSDPEVVQGTGTMFAEPGIVSVSADGATWFTYDETTDPRADTFAPTVGYEWDDANNVWGRELDPTRPLDPNIEAADFTEKTVAEMVAMYGRSAGGTAFDISGFGLDWIQYVRVEDDPVLGGTTEIDAIADVSCCGDYRHPRPTGDINGDCRVNAADLVTISAYWLASVPQPNSPAAAADIYPDDANVINLLDLAALAENWLLCTFDCD